MSSQPALTDSLDLFAPRTRDYHEFKRHFCDPNADNDLARVHVILSIVM
jgi:hypothetical protein